MSHIVEIKTEIRDLTALRSACRRLDLAEPGFEKVKLFSDVAEGHSVRLPNWRYPVVCNLPTGQVRFDNFEGRWGDRLELDRLVQRYATEKATLEARRRGHTVSEQLLPDGSIKLTIQVGETA